MGADSAIGERLEWSGKINCVIKRGLRGGGVA